MSALVGTLSALAAAPSATLLVQSRVAACVNFTAGSNCTWWADKVLSNGAPFFGTLDGQTGAASTIAGVSAKFRTFMSGSDVNIVSVGNGTALLANADVNQSSPGGFGFHDTLIWIDTEGGTVVPVEEIRAGAASSLGSPVWRELAPVGNGTGKPSMLEWRHTVMYPSMDTYEELSYFAAPGAIRPPASIESTVLWSRSTNGSTGSAAAAGRDAVVGLGDKRAIVKGSALLYAQCAASHLALCGPRRVGLLERRRALVQGRGWRDRSLRSCGRQAAAPAALARRGAGMPALRRRALSLWTAGTF